MPALVDEDLLGKVVINVYLHFFYCCYFINIDRMKVSETFEVIAFLDCDAIENEAGIP